MSADVRLVRIVTPGSGCDTPRDYTVCVSFTDGNGKVASLAFDGRADVDNQLGGMTCYGYGPYTDCPVIDGDNRQRTCNDPVAIMRNLRDALINLDLGD